MTKLVIIFLVLTFAVSVLHGKPSWRKFFNKRRDNRQQDSATDYVSACQKRENTLCAERTQEICKENPIAMENCPRLCGTCSHFIGVCPTEYVFGCCWNGDESQTVDKSDCPKCEDLNENICPRHKKDCDLLPSTPRTRRLCPITCGACHDYGN